MDDLHEASVLQKSDMVHRARIGLMLGALLGISASALFVQLVPPASQVATVVGMAALGALFRTWVASMVDAAAPSAQLRKFEPLIAKGMILVMIDVPERGVEDVRRLLGKTHPEAIDHGLEPHIPAFP